MSECKRGFCGIGIYHAKHDVNIGTLFRSAQAFGADFVFTIGKKYARQASDTCKSTKHLPYFHYEDFTAFKKGRPHDARVVAIEITDGARELPTFIHPEQALYLLGNEGGGLPQEVLREVVVKIPSSICLNVATAGSIVLYDRQAKRRS